MNRLSLYFTGPDTVDVREEPVPMPAQGQVMVKSFISGISSGTESLIYRGQVSFGHALDATIPQLSGNFRFPFKYGYSIVGTVISLGPGVDSSWMGKDVFTFHPHESLFVTSTNELVEIPKGISRQDAVFLSNMETAVNLVMDGSPVLGENVVVMGQGIVGLLTTAILSRFPLNLLITLDFHTLRRQVSQQLGAHISLEPESEEFGELLRDGNSTGADLTYEISGDTGALSRAIGLTGFGGRVVIGSWYGSKPVSLSLDTDFHRSRIRMISSQVSTIAPEFSGRWNKPRRFRTAWHMIDTVKPARLVSHYFPITQAGNAYRMLDENPGKFTQIVFTYPEAV